MTIMQKALLAPHPLAEIVPMMEGKDFEAFKAGIKANGLRNPITIYEGLILDGRNRYRACIELGIEVKIEQWDGKGSALDFVIDQNLLRRHLNKSQCAMAAANIANLKNGGDRRGENFRRPIGSLNGEAPAISTRQAAKIMDVGERSVRRAQAVRAKGSPELIRQVERGEISVNAALDQITAPEQEPLPMEVLDDADDKPDVALPGVRISLPEGIRSVEMLCRRGLEIERSEPSISTAALATKLGVAPVTWRAMRDIINLANQPDLTSAERKIVQEALTLLNKTRTVPKPHALIKPVAERVWGGKKGRRDDERIKRRLDRFEAQFAMVREACAAFSEVEIPLIPMKRAKSLRRELTQCRAELLTVEKRLPQQEPK